MPDPDFELDCFCDHIIESDTFQNCKYRIKEGDNRNDCTHTGLEYKTRCWLIKNCPAGFWRK